MSLNYKYLDFDGERFLTVYVPGEAPLLASNESHANFDKLLELAQAGDESVVDLFDTEKAISKAFADIVEGRVAVRGGVVYYDDDPMDNAITKAILRFHEEGEKFGPLVKFMENVMANPQEESREQFYRWIETHDFPIDDDGNIVAFKGVQGSKDKGFTSISSGRAFVNGEEKKGYIPNAVGDVVTMPRSEVQHDPKVACHVGLHAGTWEYASNFSRGAVMHVRINPRDVVSVPHDCTSQKVRVCRYEVIGFAEAGYDKAKWISTPVVDESAALDEPVLVPLTRENAKVGGTVRLRDGVTTRSYEGGKLKPGIDYVIELVGVEKGLRAPYVSLEGTGSNGGVHLDELVLVENGTESQKAVAGKVDTRLNHTRQKRDAKGHFIKQS